MAYKGSAFIPRRSPRRMRMRVPRPVVGALGRAMRTSGMGQIVSRIHTFKRVATPIVIQSGVGLALPTVLNGGGAPYPYLQLGPTTPAAGDVVNTITFGGAFSFALNQASAISDITSLFDNYRIKKVILRFDLSQNSAPSSSSSIVHGNAIPLLHMTPDFDDNSIPADKTTVLQNGYTKTYRLDKPVFMSVVPRAQSVVTGQTAGNNGGLLPVNTWLDCGSPAIPHFGVKFWCDDFNAAGIATLALRVTPTYILECKNVN